MCLSVLLSCSLVLCNREHAVWHLEVSLINRVHVTRWQFQRLRGSDGVFLANYRKKSLTCFCPIQRMFNCFKCSDGKVSHVWGVITLRSKFILVLRENIMVNISHLSEQPVRSHLYSSLWWGCIWKRYGGLSLSIPEFDRSQTIYPNNA